MMILNLKLNGCVKYLIAKIIHNLFTTIIINYNCILQQKIRLQFMRNLCNKFVHQLCMKESIMLRYSHLSIFAKR